MQPKVSVIIPVYNCEAFLETCIDSLRKQTLGEIEMIFVCNHIIRRYISKIIK